MKMSYEEDEIEFELQLSGEALVNEQSIAESENNYRITEIGGPREEFVPPVVVVIAAATLSVLAIRMANSWLRNNEEGVMIDLRKDPPLISTVVNVPQGHILIIDKDGNHSIEQAEYDDPEDLVPFLTTVLKPSVSGKDSPSHE